MKTLAFMLLLSIFSINAMQRLSSSSDLMQWSREELQELEAQRRVTPVPSLRCYYLDTTDLEDKTPIRYTIEMASGIVVARHTIAQRPNTW